MLPDERDWVGQILLPDEREGPLRHPPLCPLAFGESDLGERPAEVDHAGTGALGVGPRNMALDREVDLESR
jgi:hypothetical protein